MKIVIGVAILVTAGTAAWRVSACEIANMNFQEDLRDMGSQAGMHVGVAAASSDDDMNSAVIRKAKEYGIELAPSQVRVERHIGYQNAITFHLAADYTVPVKLGLFSFSLHFNPSSDKS